MDSLEILDIIEERLNKIIKKAIKEIKETTIKELFHEIVEAMKEMSRYMKSLTEKLDRLGSRVDELTERLNQLTERVDELTRRVNSLTERVDELTERLNQLTERVDELTENLNRLAGAVGEIRGEIKEWKIVDSLRGVLSQFGFGVFASAWRPFDAYIISDSFLAIVEICIKCSKKDVDQVKRAVGVAFDKLGRRPDALVVYSLEKPRKEVIDYGEKMGVIVVNSPIKLINKLRELMKKETNNK